MNPKVTFLVLLTTLLISGGYGLFTILEPNTAQITPYQLSNSLEPKNSIISASAKPADTETREHTNTARNYQTELNTVNQYLDINNFQQAVDLLNQLYSQLSTELIAEFNALFLHKAMELYDSGQSDQAIILLTQFTNSFNDLDSWTLLSNLLASSKQWKSAIDSLLRATALEYRPRELEKLMATLVSVASYLRVQLEQQRNELAINQLYKKLYEQYPNSAVFQLELAYSFLRLNDFKTAESLLTPLQYDSDFGEIAKSVLKSIDNQTNISGNQTVLNGYSSGEVMVPLIRSGNSFLVNVLINNKQLLLLVDTGASITALSQHTLQMLNLEATGKSINLNTANGVRNTKLYRTDKITLGNLSINNLEVAEIEFEQNSQIHGLLGTDLLNQLDYRYSYVLDNQKNALIFKPK